MLTKWTSDDLIHLIQFNLIHYYNQGESKRKNFLKISNSALKLTIIFACSSKCSISFPSPASLQSSFYMKRFKNELNPTPNFLPLSSPQPPLLHLILGTNVSNRIHTNYFHIDYRHIELYFVGELLRNMRMCVFLVS